MRAVIKGAGVKGAGDYSGASLPDCPERVLIAAEQRAALAHGRFNRFEFRSTLERLIESDRTSGESAADSFLDAFYNLAPVGALTLEARESQPYVPLPARRILDLVTLSKVGAHDTFIDLGSGLGRVLLTVNLLTGARCIGYELNPDLVTKANETIQNLARTHVTASQVTTVQKDITEVDFRSATIVFAYAPCFGRMWKRCADNLIHAARVNPLTVITCGPVETYLRDSPYFQSTSEASFEIHRAKVGGNKMSKRR